MLGTTNIVFNRCGSEWVSEFRLLDCAGAFTNIVEPLADFTLSEFLPKLKEIVPEHCIAVTTCKWPCTSDGPYDSIGYIITVTFDNDADEAEFIMKMT